MAFCTSCGNAFDEGDRFCSKCGAAKPDGSPDPLPASVAAETPSSTLTPEKKKGVFLRSLLAIPIWGVIIWAVFFFKGCSSTEGTATAKGAPLGDFVFVPEVCKSGEHESFRGVFLLGADEHAGGIKAISDERDGDFLDFEVPGSCSGPDNEDCTVVRVEPSMCETFKLRVKNTNSFVNEIRLLDGSLELDCTFEQGGSLVADVRFESCD
jgi:hypothetical protein